MIIDLLFWILLGIIIFGIFTMIENEYEIRKIYRMMK